MSAKVRCSFWWLIVLAGVIIGCEPPGKPLVGPQDKAAGQTAPKGDLPAVVDKDAGAPAGAAKNQPAIGDQAADPGDADNQESLELPPDDEPEAEADEQKAKEEKSDEKESDSGQGDSQETLAPPSSHQKQNDAKIRSVKDTKIVNDTKKEPKYLAGVPLIPRDILFGNPDKAAPQISPDGKQISFLAPVEGVLNVWVGPSDDPAAAKPVTSDKKRGIRRHSW